MTFNTEEQGIYTEEVYNNCTVIVLTDVNTGVQRFCWFNNDNPPEEVIENDED